MDLMAVVSVQGKDYLVADEWTEAFFLFAETNLIGAPRRSFLGGHRWLLGVSLQGGD